MLLTPTTAKTAMLRDLGIWEIWEIWKINKWKGETNIWFFWYNLSC